MILWHLKAWFGIGVEFEKVISYCSLDGVDPGQRIWYMNLVYLNFNWLIQSSLRNVAGLPKLWHWQPLSSNGVVPCFIYHIYRCFLQWVVSAVFESSLFSLKFKPISFFRFIPSEEWFGKLVLSNKGSSGSWWLKLR